MKQGRGVSVTSMKVEPIPHAISPGGADQLGQQVFQNPTPLADGRGFSAPRPIGVTSHKGGSQGEH